MLLLQGTLVHDSCRSLLSDTLVIGRARVRDTFFCACAGRGSVEGNQRIGMDWVRQPSGLQSWHGISCDAALGVWTGTGHSWCHGCGRYRKSEKLRFLEQIRDFRTKIRRFRKVVCKKILYQHCATKGSVLPINLTLFLKAAAFSGRQKLFPSTLGNISRSTAMTRKLQA